MSTSPCPDPEAWRRSGRFLAFGQHRVFCIDSAPGDFRREVLFLIHGFPTASWDFAKVWPMLSERFRVIAVDLLGFGFSSKPTRHEYSIFEQADLVESAVRQLELGQFHLLAHDYGDTVAQELLARCNANGQPALLSVSFLNGGLFPETHRPRPVQKLLRGPLGPLVGRLMSRRRFARAMTEIFGPHTPPDAAELDGFWALVTHGHGRRIAHRLIRYVDERSAQRERWVGALRNAACPLALIDGAADPVSGAHMVARYREVVGKGYVAELPGIGHYPQVEAPDLVAGHFFGFLQSVGLATDAGRPA